MPTPGKRYQNLLVRPACASRPPYTPPQCSNARQSEPQPSPAQLSVSTPSLSHCRMASPRGRLPNFLLLDLQSTIDCRAGTPQFQTKYLLAEEQEPLECKNCLGKAWRNVVSTYEAIRELDVLAVDVKQECKLLSLRDIAVRHRFDSRYSATPGRGRGATVGNPFAS